MKKIILPEFFKSITIVLIIFLITSCGSDSNDNRGLWEPAGLENMQIFEIKEADGSLYAAAGRNGVFRKDINSDSGWEFLGLDEPEARVGISTVEVDPSTGTLYAGFNKLNPSTFTNSIAGIFRSTDSGATWEPFDSGFEEATGGFRDITLRLKASPLDDDLMFARTSMGQFRKNPGTDEWTFLEESLVAGDIDLRAFSINPSNIAQIWAGAANASTQVVMMKSDDNGDTWKNVGLGGVQEFVDGVREIAIDPMIENTIYACLISKLVRSNDAGETWEEVIQDELDGEPVSFACTAVRFHPDTPGTMITAGGVIRMTENGGETWRQISEEDRKGVRSIYIDWQQRKVYAGLMNPDEGLFLIDF